MMEHLLPKLGWQRGREVKVNIKEGWGEWMRSEVKWHCGVGWWGVCGRKGCAPPCPLPLARQLFVWPSRSLVQTLDHAPLHPNSRNFTGATLHICFGIADWRTQTGSLEAIRLEIKISCWFSSNIIEVCTTQCFACCIPFSFSRKTLKTKPRYRQKNITWSLQRQWLCGKRTTFKLRSPLGWDPL